MADIPDSLYQQIHKLMPIVCVDTVVYHEQKILLIKRAKKPAEGKWWFPGGRLLRGENLANAAIRITRAESGLSVRNPIYLGHGETLFDTDPFGHGAGTHTVNFVFCAYANALEVMSIVLDDNHSAWSMFSPDEIYNSDSHPYLKRFVALSEGVVRR